MLFALQQGGGTLATVPGDRMPVRYPARPMVSGGRPMSSMNTFLVYMIIAALAVVLLLGGDLDAMMDALKR